MKLRHVTHRSTDGDKEQVLRFSGSDYARATRSRLAAPWGDEIYGLAAAFEEERCIGTTSYAISPHRLGILSQVFTDVDFRGQGVARATIDEALHAFRQHQTRAVYLGSAKEWVRRIYRGVGFDFAGAMGERHAFKLTLDDSGREESLFRPGQRVSLRAWAAHDQADLSALFNAEHGCLVKHYELGCYLGSHFEGEFYQLRRYEEERRGFRAVVLEGEETLLGLGTVVPSARRHEGHRGIVDVLVHPTYAAHGSKMIAALHEQTELESLVAYAGEQDEDRRSMLEAAGYSAIGKLTRCLRIAGRAYDLLMFERQRAVAEQEKK